MSRGHAPRNVCRPLRPSVWEAEVRTSRWLTPPLNWNTGTMKVPLAILAAVLLHAGCAGKANPHPTSSGPSAAPSPLKTFTSPAFHFSVAYDPHVFTAEDRGIPPRIPFFVAGTGMVSGPTTNLLLLFKSPPPLLQFGRNEFNLVAIRPARPAPPPTLDALGHESEWRMLTRGELLETSPPNPSLRVRMHLSGLPTATSVNGLPALRYAVRFGNATAVNYGIFHAGFIYYLQLVAPTSHSSATWAQLNAVLQTFTVRP